MIPLEVDGNFTADASGNGTDKRIIQAGHWCAVYASCQCAGSGQWVAGKLGRAQFFQQGANVLMGPIILPPGQQAQVTVAGATPGAVASIVYWGWQSDTEDGADLAAAAPSIESAGSLSGTVPIPLSGNVGVFNAPGTNLGTRQDQTLLVNGVTVPFGALTSLGTLTLPAGTHALAVLYQQSGGVAPLQQLIATGQTSGFNWATPLGSTTLPGQIFKVLQSIDSQLTMQIQFGSGAGNAKVWVAAILDTMVEVPDSQQAGLVAIAGNQLASQPIGYDGGGGSSMLVSLRNAVAAPWQAANQPPAPINLSLGAGATAIIIPAPAPGLRIYLHQISYSFTAAANFFGTFQDTSGTPVVFGNWSSQTGVNPAPLEGHGAPLAPNVALVVKNAAGGAMTNFMTGWAAYSIG